MLVTSTVLSASSDDAIKSGPGISLELERLSLLSREQLAETLAQSVVQLKKLREELRGAELENHYLRELLRLARIEKYGSGSEKLSEEQLALLELEPGVSQAEVEAESERAQLKLPLRRTYMAGKQPWATGITRTFATGGKDYPLYSRTVCLCSVRESQGAHRL